MWLGKIRISDGFIFMIAFVIAFCCLFGNGNGNYMPGTVMTHTEYQNISELGTVSGQIDKALNLAIDAYTPDDKSALLDYVELTNEIIGKIYEYEIPEEFIPYRDNVLKEVECSADIAYHLYYDEFDLARDKVEEKNAIYKNGVDLFRQGLTDIGCSWYENENGIHFSIRKEN